MTLLPNTMRKVLGKNIRFAFSRQGSSWFSHPMKTSPTSHLFPLPRKIHNPRPRHTRSIHMNAMPSRHHVPITHSFNTYSQGSILCVGDESTITSVLITPGFTTQHNTIIPQCTSTQLTSAKHHHHHQPTNQPIYQPGYISIFPRFPPHNGSIKNALVSCKDKAEYGVEMRMDVTHPLPTTGK
ncbi:hypothetical protein BO78DRAFT_1177 [Aspergillus sclerotiicarbonarius CBS 121057]|uniref:Uncharacterized protein n=1 Tax=Aspergillus sclerotiicarbonarius (strain CBS 121057 / IBT 28362) TaxID=1448318 RepID=A0A319F7R7_ASPSB|nr:hypothetical protein BO78DRAFT_1177 [Aspergillus sclerotiicarbonarius CBS 121057]